ncbi:MAG: methylated-DNA--[protein]-cysteine S-methyltransferase [Pseudomonadota bacterium]
MTPPLRHSYHHSPVGPLLMAGDERALHYLSFPGGSRAMSPADDWPRDDGFFGEVRRQLDAYFAGELTAFTVTQQHTGTAFQQQVWTALQAIPYGETLTYGELARRIGKPTASRAVGAANGANPLPIMTPCHRVIGADNSLTGFGGGLETKRFLLALEQRDLLSNL